MFTHNTQEIIARINQTLHWGQITKVAGVFGRNKFNVRKRSRPKDYACSNPPMGSIFLSLFISTMDGQLHKFK